jgi:DnaJ-class molecular chaperone
LSKDFFHHPASGKGDAPCRVNKRKFDQNYLRLYGIQCQTCRGAGVLPGRKCTDCNGLGYLEKPRERE